MTTPDPNRRLSAGPTPTLLTRAFRFPFAAARRLARSGWTAERNEEIYGAGKEGRWGRGENYQAHLILEESTEPRLGLPVGCFGWRDRVGARIADRYDHRFLNLDTPAYSALPPTPENLARGLLRESRETGSIPGAAPAVCHLQESPETSATAYVSGRTEREFWLSFSAARQTCSPHLSEEENRKIFGEAASPLGHGHGYRLRVVLGGPWDEDTGQIVPLAACRRILTDLHDRLDHKHLNLEVPEWRGQPMTTECMSRSIHTLLARVLPVRRISLFETPEFLAEYDGRRAALGLSRSFSVTHRLFCGDPDEEENAKRLGRCSQPGVHGHRYVIQATVAGPIDERTGIVHELAGLSEILDGVLVEFDQRHLEEDLEDFQNQPSTGENILRTLWSRLDSLLGAKLYRLRLQESEDSRITLRRRDPPGGA